jgi:hypothetical protein
MTKKLNQKITKKRKMRIGNKKNNKTNKRKNVKGGIDYSINDENFSKVEKYTWDPIEEDIDDFENNIKKRNFSEVINHRWNTLEEDIDNIKEIEMPYLEEKIQILESERKIIKENINSLHYKYNEVKKDKKETRVVGKIRSIEIIEKKIVEQKNLLSGIETEIRNLKRRINNIKKSKLTSELMYSKL